MKKSIAYLTLLILAVLLAVPAHAVSTWANGGVKTISLTTTTTGGQYTTTSTLAVGDTVFMSAASAGGLSQNNLYYVISFTAGSPNTIQLALSPGGAKITGTTTSGTAVSVVGVYVWDATAANNVQTAASWDTVPNAVDAAANIANVSNGANLTFQNAATVGTINFSGASDTLWVSSAASGSTLSALTLATSIGLPAITNASNKLIRLGAGDATMKNGTLKLAGNQGVILSVTGSGSFRLCSLDLSGFSGGITVQNGQVDTDVTDGLRSGTAAQSVTVGNASTITSAGFRMGYGGTINIDALNGTSKGRVWTGNATYGLNVGYSGGSGTFPGIIGVDLTGAPTTATFAFTKVGAGTETISGYITNGVAVTVNGAGGTLALNGPNAYFGTTTVTAPSTTSPTAAAPAW